MYLILRDSTGRRFEAMLLALGEHGMRIALRGDVDTTELTRRQDQWISKDCGPVEVESMVAGDQPLSALEFPAVYQAAG